VVVCAMNVGRRMAPWSMVRYLQKLSARRSSVAATKVIGAGRCTFSNAEVFGRLAGSNIAVR
jgi:hypothetical protein